MSKVKISGNASGTGVFTIAAPNSNTDRTFNLPDEAGTVLTSASSISQQAQSGVPCFHAYVPSDSSFSSGWNLMPNSTERFDIGSNFNTGTYRFVAPVDGYYHLMSLAGGTGSILRIISTVRVNDTPYGFGGQIDFPSTGASEEVNMPSSNIIYMDAGDYAESWCYLSGSGSYQSINYNWFAGYLVREV